MYVEGKNEYDYNDYNGTFFICKKKFLLKHEEYANVK